jgi:hypothetical protein
MLIFIFKMFRTKFPGLVFDKYCRNHDNICQVEFKLGRQLEKCLRPH